jgi:HEAT repeat protein
MIRAVAIALLLLVLGARFASADKVRDLTLQLRSSHDERVRRAAVIQLAVAKDPRALSACIGALQKDTDADVRRAATFALFGLLRANPSAGDKARVLAALASAASDPDLKVQRSAARISSRVRRIAVPATP